MELFLDGVASVEVFGRFLGRRGVIPRVILGSEIGRNEISAKIVCGSKGALLTWIYPKRAQYHRERVLRAWNKGGQLVLVQVREIEYIEVEGNNALLAVPQVLIDSEAVLELIQKLL